LSSFLEGKRVLVTGGTGSLGQVLVRRILEGSLGVPESVTVFSRSEALQHDMRIAFQHRRVATDEIVYEERRHERLNFLIGDIRDPRSTSQALERADIVFHAAAMKQVPACEFHPIEAVKTNAFGAQNIVELIAERDLAVEAVIGVSTDKACKPVNVMGMTKALQERILLSAPLRCTETRFAVARYGNVLASRGSVVPLFREQIRSGGPVTITTPEMTRFLMSLEEAVDTVLAAAVGANSGDTYVPRPPAARVVDLAAAMIGSAPIETEITGIRPGEKLHEDLISEEESPRTIERDDHLVITPILPDLRRPDPGAEPFGRRQLTSNQDLLDIDGVRSLLARHGFAEGAAA
jgi:UDP-glucose 4-epimerase